MAILDEARAAIAAAVTGAGLACQEYPPDAVNAPLAWVDSVDIDFTAPQAGLGSFCAPGLAAASVVTVGQRHDRPGAVAYLEGLVAPITKALYGIPGLRLVAANSGSVTVGGQDLPGVVYTVQFNS